MSIVRRWLLTLAEGVSWAVGLAGLALWVSFEMGVATRTRHDLDRLDALQVEAAHPATPDRSLWSPVRVSAWLKVSREPGPARLAVLRIPKIRLEVPVLPGTDNRTLYRAVGHIEDTAPPGTDGNYFVGSAPRRSIVRALHVSDKPPP